MHFMEDAKAADIFIRRGVKVLLKFSRTSFSAHLDMKAAYINVLFMRKTHFT
jgi:hypothetical protein